jgi:hypothetical protein
MGTKRPKFSTVIATKSYLKFRSQKNSDIRIRASLKDIFSDMKEILFIEP